MKQLKFEHVFAQRILRGEKTATIRLWDDKDIGVGDTVQVVDKVHSDEPLSWNIIGEAFVKAVELKPLRELNDVDFDGHEAYASAQDMLSVFRGYYGNDVALETEAKVIYFSFSSYKEPLAYIARADSKQLPKRVLLYADGGSRGNPGPSALGYVICSPDDELVLVEGSKYLGITTNNQAEYHALREGLEACAALGAMSVAVRMDSLLVVNQLKGIFKVKNRDLWPIYDAVRQLSKRFSEISFDHVPRELNKKADAEVNKALDAKRGDG
jgi:ribonuclease HI